ncbi:MAG TPA: hypothetical protein VGC09_00295, partial [Rhodopila sp.]
ASRLKPQRMVRCARCGSEWEPVREVDEAAAPPRDVVHRDLPEQPPSDGGAEMTSLPEITAMDRLAASPAKPPASRRLMGAWAGTFAVLAAAVIATVIWRQAVVRFWPPSGRILQTSEQATPRDPSPPHGPSAPQGHGASEGHGSSEGHATPESHATPQGH